MRALTSIAVLAAALALLAGCGGDDDATTSSTTSSTTSTPATGPTGPDAAESVEPPASEQGGGDEGDGGGGNGGGVDPAAGKTPENALEAFFTSGDPDVACGQVVTADLVKESYGSEEGCRQAQVPGAVADSIEIKELNVDGENAEAIVVPKGGPNDGFDHDVALIRVGGAWVLNEIDADIPAGP